MYIALEGIDTAGKSTQIELLKNEYKNNILFIKEPGFTKFGTKIREIIFNDDISKKAELFLFLADRAETIEKFVKPNLHKNILTDRSVISGIAYAMEFFDFNMLVNLNKFATDGIFPEFVIILKLDKETLQYRLSQKNHDNIEKRGLDYLINIQDNMIEVCNRLEIPYLLLDASKNIEEINFRIKKVISEYMDID
ncbi:thymidylate kinase [Nautilia profundicola AmH]|uniref:Thymidylate kinase n=1 Tax=Nautilia profundicola (strain ATCC BAA-1463 / DSM 18972 / AmH) TaxID=598659 RepID=KTHY_NAUPA|nr:dTMP kinase [Nautilia profundicola]B9L9C1.1 RecName: Full=Thymidylate kinase; AltName: Full=dTMP kinase [Nautilia profundicola AmH]ACM92146.1 thymidylate kinase [Nautilia profundicola AmH]